VPWISLLVFFAFLSDTAIGIFVYIKGTQNKPVTLAFSFLSWACAGWAFSVLLIFLSEQWPWMLFWGEMSFAASSLASAAFLWFSRIFPQASSTVNRRSFWVAPLWLGILLLTFSGFVLTGVSHTKIGFKTTYGPGYPFFSVFIFGCIFYGLYSLVIRFRSSAGIQRLQVKYCFLGMLFASIVAVSTNLILPLLGTSKLSGLGPSCTVIMVAFIAYAIVKYRLMDINVVLKKGTTYFLLLVFLFVPSLLLILLGQSLFFAKVDYLFSILVFTLLFLVAFFFQKIKPRTERAVEQLLFKNRYDYRETLTKFSKALVTILDLSSLAERILETVTDAMGVERASLFLLNEEKGNYSLMESKNISLPETLPKGDPFSTYLQKIGEIIVREELMKGASLQDLRKIVDQMSLLGAEVSIPLISKGHLIGMINLSYKFNRDVYSHEDIDLLGTLANQAAIAIENARLYEDLKRSKSYMRRADRLASLGTLTAGLAHEIRNPLVAIKTFTQLLPERLDDEEFRNHFLHIASGEVDRISSLINELLDFARPSEPKLDEEDINAILDGMILLISTETKKKRIEMVKRYEPDLPSIQIDGEQMKQVFLNILLNAIEATPEDGGITVRTRSFVKPGGERYIQIEFTDTGCGIPAEYLEDIFTPFFTTKTKGSGLGLSISNQIVQDHKGYIDVESRLNKGSSFFINLPLRQDHPKRRKSDLEKNHDLPNFLEGR